MGVVMIKFRAFHAAALATMVVAGCFASSASAAPFNLFQMPFDQQPAQSMQAPADEGELSEAPARFKRQVADYRTNELPGTIIIDTPNTYLYLVLGNGQAIRYVVGVGRDGQQWAGVSRIDGKYVQPAWAPPEDIRRENPALPNVIPGGSSHNPMGVAALTLQGGEYAIHGTNAPGSVGHFVSHGCIRMYNADITDLYQRVAVGTTVVVTR